MLGPATVPPPIQGLATLLIGAGFGVAVAAVDHAESTPMQLLTIVIGGGAAWATFGILMAAWWRRHLALSVAAAASSLAAAVLAYYVADAFAVGDPLSHEYDDLRFWTLGALVVGLPLGFFGWRARRDDTWLGLAALLVAPLGFATESAIYLDGFESLSTLERAARLAITGVALAVTVALASRRLTKANTRPGSPSRTS